MFAGVMSVVYTLILGALATIVRWEFKRLRR